MGSKEQSLLTKKLIEILPESKRAIKEDFRPQILINPRTGNPLEMDIYLLSYHVGIEYQGDMHFRYINKFHNDVDSSRLNDTIKSDLTLDAKVLAIIEIFPCDLEGNFRDNFLQRLENTQRFYFINKKFRQVRRLQKLKANVCYPQDKTRNYLSYRIMKDNFTILDGILSTKRNKETRIKNFIEVYFLKDNRLLFDRKFFEDFIEYNLDNE